MEADPDVVVVVGDVNSTVACSLVAVKLGIAVAHVEAGLRSFDRAMPEEINRIVTDSISSLLYVSEPSGVTNLRAEGIHGDRVQHVGNVMIDTLLRNRSRAQASTVLDDLSVQPKDYAVMTLHRPSNVDDQGAFERILGAFERLEGELPHQLLVSRYGSPPAQGRHPSPFAKEHDSAPLHSNRIL